MIKAGNSKPTISKKVLSSQVQNAWTNHFDVSVNKKQQVFQLSVKFKPALPRDDNRTLNRLMKSGNTQLAEILGKTFFTTADTVYTLKELKDETVSINVENFILTLQQTNTFSIGDINDPIKHPLVNRFLNIVIKGYMESQGFKEYGKHASYFPSNEKPNTIDQGLSILRGFKITVDRYLDESIKINIDTCFRISSTRSIFIEFTEHLREARGDKDSAKSKFTFENIVGKSFCIQNDFTKMVKIHGVDPKKTLKSPSPVDGWKSMKDYFEETYKVKLNEPNQFICFNEKKKMIGGQITAERTFYPSELLFGLGLKESQKKDFRLMKEIAAITKMRPEKKRESIMGCSKLMKSICADIDMKINPSQNNSVPTVVLTSPEFTIRNNKNLRAKDGIIFFKDEIYSKADFSNWAIVYESSDDYVNRLFAYIGEVMDKLGVKYEEPYWYALPKKPELKDFKDALEEVKEEGCTFVMMVMGRFSADNFYKKVKEFADLKVQILTQVVKENPKIFEKRGFFDKLVFQMCSKLGYPLWIVQKPQALQQADTMLIGADVYHSKGKESVTAVIGTLNNDYSRFCSLSNVQEKRGQEIMDNVAEMVMECVSAYVDKCKKVPAKILFYRDGVGDTMMDLVTKYELTKIKDLLQAKYGKDTPKITFVVVTKRISDKSLTLSPDGSVSNPPSGTILSTSIIKKEMEFFMIAQNVTEGTATPTRYQLLLNECGYSSDDLHQITFFQAFNYYGWSGAVKVPAVCQYAHKLAYHVGENYRQSNKFMKYNLYYL